jgi:transposase
MPAFNGLTDIQWQMLEPLLPPEPERKRAGRAHNQWRHVLNSILWIKFSGARWCDLPRYPNFASRTAAHRWMLKWQHNGTLIKIFAGLRNISRLCGLVDWQKMAVDGSFSPYQGPRSRRHLRAQRQRLHDTFAG